MQGLLILVIVIFILTVVNTGILGYLIYKSYTKEGFCGACQGIGKKVYPDREKLHDLYNEGELTEFTHQ